MRALSTERFAAPRSEFEPGPAPMLAWVEIEKLVVDDSYQREIGKRGAINVAQIADNFDWSKFAPVIVAPIEGGNYAIVDGQHRTTAALLRGQKTVPCQVVQADRAKQAAAFAAVNGNVTKTTPVQIFYARLSAGDEATKAVADVCLDAGVKLARRNMVTANMTVGQTVAAGALARCYAIYGRGTLVMALRCVTRSADGNAGFLRATIIEALCSVLHEHTDWRDSGDQLLGHMNKFSFPDAWEQIAAGRDKIFPNTAKTDFAARVTKHLARRFSALPKREAA
jgi:ParB-like nuclease domain